MAFDPTVLVRIRARDETRAAFQSARRQLDVLRSHAKYALAGAALAGGEFLRRGISQVVGVVEQTESLRATLRVVTGSVDEATRAFASLESQASRLPFQVEELVQAFIQLKAFGLDASSAALTSYANTASAFGKRLGEFVEGVADAVTGEFERIKQFGVRARVEGEKIRFVFRGVTTEVRNNAADIERYLLRLGKVEYGFPRTCGDRPRRSPPRGMAKVDNGGGSG